MEPNAADARYTRPARWFHWLIFAFVALAYLLINLRGIAAKGSAARTLSMQGHMLAGLIVLVLILPRLLHRLRHAPPPIVPPLATWEGRLSRLTHFLLYAFLIVQPLLSQANVRLQRITHWRNRRLAPTAAMRRVAALGHDVPITNGNLNRIVCPSRLVRPERRPAGRLRPLRSRRTVKAVHGVAEIGRRSGQRV